MQSDNEQSSNQLYWVQDNLLATDFPPLSKALRDPDGLLAIGGTLSSERLIDAYKKGIFPWFNHGQPVMWWSPDPRCILIPDEIKISRSLAKRIKQDRFKVTYDKAFWDVINECSAARNGIRDTWITEDMKEAYFTLHKLGYSHSIECWLDDELVGGLYGIAMGKIFFGESMFSRSSDASKVALVNLSQQLKEKGFKLIDCQVHSKHLQSLGAKPVQRELFVQFLDHYCNDDKTIFNRTD